MGKAIGFVEQKIQLPFHISCFTVDDAVNSLSLCLSFVVEYTIRLVVQVLHE
jgi:hypothetical protein